MARAKVATVMIAMLALAMLATATAEVDKAKGEHNSMRRKLLKLQATESIHQRQTCDWIWGKQYCPGGTQFNCCRGETDSRWTGCTLWDNNYVCPDERPKAVCCWT